MDQDKSVSPPAETGGSIRDLHKTSDIRFVMTEVAKLTERIDNLIRLSDKQETSTSKGFDKIDSKFDKMDDRLKEIEKKAVYVAGGIAMLSLVAVVISFFFHSNLESIAAAVAKLGK